MALKRVVFFILGIFLFIPITRASDYSIESMDYNLVDGGKHLDYRIKSRYTYFIKRAANVWNKEIPIIRKDTYRTINDVTFLDRKMIADNIVGETRPDGTITFSTSYMNMLSYPERLNVCIHEIGHALGLAHREDEMDSVMYPFVEMNIRLTKGDKANLRFAYNHYGNIGGGIR